MRKEKQIRERMTMLVMEMVVARLRSTTHQATMLIRLSTKRDLMCLILKRTELCVRKERRSSMPLIKSVWP